MKKSLLTMCLTSAVFLSAQEVWKAQSRDDWHIRKPAVLADGVFSHASGQRLIAEKSFNVAEGKKYFRSTVG